MITEIIVRGLLAFVKGLDALIPPIDWPEWLSMPIDYFQDNFNAGAINLNALFVWIHPLSIDVMALMVAMKATERLVRRMRALASTATGGGGVHT